MTQRSIQERWLIKNPGSLPALCPPNIMSVSPSSTLGIIGQKRLLAAFDYYNQPSFPLLETLLLPYTAVCYLNRTACFAFSCMVTNPTTANPGRNLHIPNVCNILIRVAVTHMLQCFGLSHSHSAGDIFPSLSLGETQAKKIIL